MRAKKHIMLLIALFGLFRLFVIYSWQIHIVFYPRSTVKRTFDVFPNLLAAMTSLHCFVIM